MRLFLLRQGKASDLKKKCDSKKFVLEDHVPELDIDCPVCDALAGAWCHKPGHGPGIHAARIEAYTNKKS